MDVLDLVDGVAGVSDPDADGGGLGELAAFVEVCDPLVLDQLLRGVEVEARVLEARRAVLLAAAERRKVYRSDAHASMWGMLRANLGWSDGECRTRMRVARLCDRFPEALDSLATAAVSVANLAEIARGFANPRCGEQIEAVLGGLLNDAARREHDEVRDLVRRWETLTDVDGAHRQAGIDHESRNAHVTEFAGIVTVVGTLAGVEGAEVREIFERFADAEFRTDWDAARAQHGNGVSKAVLARTDAQRRADALLAIFRTAAAAAPGTQWHRPVVNIVVDQRTFEDHLTLQGLFPERYDDPWDAVLPLLRERRCETTTGVAVTPAEVFQAANPPSRDAAIRAMYTPRMPGPTTPSSRPHRALLARRRDGHHQRQPRLRQTQPRPLHPRRHRHPRHHRLAHLPTRRHRNRLTTTTTPGEA